MSDYTVAGDGCWDLVIVSHSVSLLNTDLDLPFLQTQTVKVGPENLISNTPENPHTKAEGYIELQILGLL